MSITFTLAKQLANAGFRQFGHGKYAGDRANTVARRADQVYAPTLSELIEACGELYKEKYEFILAWSIDQWYATYVDANNHVAEDLDSYHGATPEEAVARLWLSLNKKEGGRSFR